MGELFEHSLQLKVGNKIHTIRPVERRLVREDETSFSMKDAVRLPGGLIVGEGDSGKTIFTTLLANAAASNGPTTVINLRDAHGLGQVQLRKTQDHLLTGDGNRGHATIILDGLDENRESAQGIIDFCNSDLNPSVALWVTSRPCDAASRLQQFCELFIRPYHLSTFNEWDAERMAKGICDPELFIDAVKHAGLSSFLSKPGGTVLMLKAFANGKLTQAKRMDVMDLFAREFARESRGGHVASATEETADIDQLVDATEWIATCLFLTSKDSIWTGEAIDVPVGALLASEIPTGRHTRRLFASALQRRLFEPLNSDQLRLTYADMPSYMAGSWLARHISLQRLFQLIPPKDGYVTDSMYRMLAWAGQRNPDFCLPWIERQPEIFFACHTAIERIGIPRYFAALAKRSAEPRFFNSDGYWYDHVCELDGCEAMRAHCLKVIRNNAASERELILASFLLRGHSTGNEESAEAVVETLVKRRLGNYAKSWIAGNLEDICNTRRFACLKHLISLLPQICADTDEEEFKGYVIKLLWPQALSSAQLKTLMSPRPLEKMLHTSYVDFATKLNSDLGHDWIREVQKRERDWRQHRNRKTGKQKFRAPIHSRYLPMVIQKSEADPKRAKTSLVRMYPKTSWKSQQEAINQLSIQEMLALHAFLKLHFKVFAHTADGDYSITPEGQVVLSYEHILERGLLANPTAKILDEIRARTKAPNGRRLHNFLKKYEKEFLERKNALHLQFESLEAIERDSAMTIPPSPIRKVKTNKPRTRAKDGELTQKDVAKDFHVARKTVLGWEKGKNNPWNYTKELRTNPTLRGAYQILVNQAKLYFKAKETAEKSGKRFRYTFVQFQEKLLLHSNKVT